MINELTKYVSVNDVWTQYQKFKEEFSELEKAATVNSKEEYLEWVKQWKASVKNLEAFIRHLKYMRSTKRLLADTEFQEFYKDLTFNIEYYPNKEAYVKSYYAWPTYNYRCFAKLMYELRIDMKQKSKLAKEAKKVA